MILRSVLKMRGVLFLAGTGMPTAVAARNNNNKNRRGKMKTEKDQCSNCLFFRQSEIQNEEGSCHFNPPSIDGKWPLIIINNKNGDPNNNNWCGEYRNGNDCRGYKY